MSPIGTLEQGWWTSASAWRAGKDAIELVSPVDNLLLHVIAGILIFGAAYFVRADARRGWTAWTVTLVITLLNEVVDITTERWPNISEQFAEAGFDLAVTMAIPTFALIYGSTRVARASASQKSARTTRKR